MSIEKKTGKAGAYYLATERLPSGKLLLAEGATQGLAFSACLTLIKENGTKQATLRRVK